MVIGKNHSLKKQNKKKTFTWIFRQIFRYYVRAAILVQYFFYKNVAAFTPQVLMAIFNNFSTQSIYDSVNLTLFNIVFTSLPIFCYGMLEQNIPSGSLMSNPGLYKTNAKNRLLAKDKCIWWNLEAFWHCLVVFFGFYFYWNSTESQWVKWLKLISRKKSDFHNFV